MAPLADRIVAKLKVQARALDDDELAAYLGVIRQAVNQACRRLEREGIVERYVGANNKIVNRLRSSEAREVVASPRASPLARPDDRTLLSEDEVKEAVKAHLEAQGFEVTVAWARTRGADIVATRPGCRLVLEAKGEVLLQPQQVPMRYACHRPHQRRDWDDRRWWLGASNDRPRRPTAMAPRRATRILSANLLESSGASSVKVQENANKRGRKA